MIGAIIGDVVGSRFEFKDHSGKDFELFVSGCAATDDSFMTLAIANALLLAKGDYSNLESLAEYSMKQVAQEHPKTMWGAIFTSGYLKVKLKQIVMEMVQLCIFLLLVGLLLVKKK